jgi:hypothetical protein
MEFTRKLVIAFSFAVFVIVTIFISGCNKDNVTDSVLTDEQYLQYIVASGYSTNQNDEDNLMSYEISDLDNGGAIKDDDNGPMGSPIDSLIRWGRRISNANVNFNLTSQGDSVKTVRVTRTITGHYIIIGWKNGLVDSVTKPYTEVFYRDVAFKRINTLPNPRLNWRLYRVSMLSGGTTQPQVGNNLVSVTKVEVYINGSLTPSYIFNGPDFTQNIFTTMYFGGIGIPSVNRGSSVKIKVYTTSQESDIDYVAWHWARNTLGFHRIPFALESQSGSGPYYRVYAKTFNIYANHKLGVFNGYISASSHESLFDDDISKFASSQLGIPYKILQ